MKKIIFFIIIFITLLFLYGKYIEPNNFKVREYSITNSKLDDVFDGFKIVHLSDLYFNGYNLDNIKDAINKLDTDIIVITGNILKDDNEDNNNNKLIDFFNSLNNKQGIYLVKGNIDNNIDSLLESTSIKLLDNETINIYNGSKIPISLTGLSNELDISNISEFNGFKIVISHKPDNFDFISNYNPDIFLAGNSLNGQIRLPFIGAILKFDGSKKYFDPIYNINNSSIFISNGLGNPSYDFRLFNTPSINFYRLYNK